MIPVLLIIIPLISGFAAFFMKNEKSVRSWALFSSVLTLAISLFGLTYLKDAKYLHHESDWMSSIGSSFSVGLDGMGQILCLLTSVVYPIILIATWKSRYKKPNNFFALMLLAQAGLMGVFVAMDALLFYFFWELALIPMYFLCSQWGGEKRIQATFKFFIYTFVGSVLMLVGIIYLYTQTSDHSFSIESFYKLGLSLSSKTQNWVFWLFFAAFAIKMPIFPFHTWQPDVYEQSPTSTTMVLSGVMVKMGVFAVIRWLLPVVSIASFQWGDVVTSLSITGMIYASLIAIQQDDLKRLVAYSSIAHLGLMCATIFSETQIGMQGVMIQMFNHGINVIGLWIVVELIERQFGTRKISELGGLAQKAPALAIFAVTIALANIALPLTNAFVGEFMMFNGIFSSKVTHYNIIFTILAGVTIILAAVYTLNMIRKVFYGNTNALTATAHDINWNEKIALGIIVILIFWMGVYPNTMINLTNDISESILKKSDVLPLIMKH
ncbi:MAG: NuoM family protein [Chitinophagales bacterium]